MTDKIAFDLISPERLLLSESADMVTVPGSEGDMGVMAGHMPLISTLRPGIIAVSGGSKGDVRFFVRGGFAEINPQKITVLAEEAIPMDKVDAALLDARIVETEENILQAKSEADRARAVAVVDSLKILRASL